MLRFFFFLFLSLNLAGQSKVVDHHVHIFSPVLLDSMKNNGRKLPEGIFEVTCDSTECGNLDKIANLTSSYAVLLSATYIYSNIDSMVHNEYGLVKAENDWAYNLLGASEYEGKMKLFCGINPLKDYALQELKRCVEELNFAGVKLHLTGSGVDIFNEDHVSRLQAIANYVESNNIPILIHNNLDNYTEPSLYYKKLSRIFLENRKQMKIVFAHGGGQGGFNTKTYKFIDHALSVHDDESSNQLYFEVSGVILKQEYIGKIESNVLGELVEKHGTDHFLFGSDFPFRTSESYFKIIKEEESLSEEVLTKIAANSVFN